MKSITTQQLLRLAQIPNSKEELHNMSYAEILAVKDKLEKLISQVRDSQLFSILLRFKHEVIISEEYICQEELQKIKDLSSLEEIISYIAQIEKREMPIYV